MFWQCPRWGIQRNIKKKYKGRYSKKCVLEYQIPVEETYNYNLLLQ